MRMRWKKKGTGAQWTQKTEPNYSTQYITDKYSEAVEK